jgi:3-deoxy-7-phosphoheptulonate synthase
MTPDRHDPVAAAVERARAAAGPEPHRPDWSGPALAAARADLAARPPLVRPREVDRLRARLAEVAAGRAFLLQGGDCAETFGSVRPERIGGQVDTLLAMADRLAEGLGVPTVAVGRIAGQHAKPRSRPTETRGGVQLPGYRGDAVNDLEFTAAARTPEPSRLTRSYQASADALAFIGAHPGRGGREFFVSHEALLLDYELPLTRRDPDTGRRYALSGHLLWIGERTRQPEGAHVEFAAAVANPVAVKLGPTATADDALRLIDRLDPDRVPGRLAFITRLGADRVREALPPLLAKVAASGAVVGWICDPMHGNTVALPDGRKTRRLEDVAAEIAGFFEAHRALGLRPGGVHLELTGEPVTECLGGEPPLGPDDLTRCYTTACDPRLNRSQALLLARQIGRFAAES